MLSENGRLGWIISKKFSNSSDENEKKNCLNFCLLGFSTLASTQIGAKYCLFNPEDRNKTWIINTCFDSYVEMSKNARMTLNFVPEKK